MKKIICFSMIISLFVTVQGQEKKNYDLSTPKKMIESFNLIGEGIPDYQAISVFYDNESAASINAFDEAVENERAEFKKFRKYIEKNFPTKVQKSTDTKIEIRPYDTSYSTVSFSYTTTGFIEQFVKFKAGSVKYVSDTLIDNNIVVIAIVNGKEKKFSLYNDNGSYKVKLEQKNIDGLNNALSLVNKAVEFLKKINAQIRNGDLNDYNFGKLISQWHQELMGQLDAK